MKKKGFEPKFVDIIKLKKLWEKVERFSKAVFYLLNVLRGSQNKSKITLK